MASNDSSSKSPFGSFYTPLLISLIGVVSTCIALVLYHFVFVKLCSRRTPTITTTTTEPLPQDASVLTTGVDQKLLKTIPIIAYSAHEDGDKFFFRLDQIECAVCLGELEHGELVRLLPNCKHAFHVSCIDEWFVAHTSCPICRSAIVVEASSVVENQVPTTLTPPLSSLDGSNRVELPFQKDDQRGKDINAGNNVASSSGVETKPFAMLQHSVSLVLPTDRTSPLTRGIIGLKRSLSLDQSSVIIDMQQERETGRDCSSSSSSSSSSKDDLTENRTASRSMKHFDCVSAKLLMSFSRLRMGKINSDSLPY